MLVCVAGVSAALLTTSLIYEAYFDRQHLPDPGAFERFEFTSIGRILDSQGNRSSNWRGSSARSRSSSRFLQSSAKGVVRAPWSCCGTWTAECWPSLVVVRCLGRAAAYRDCNRVTHSLRQPGSAMKPLVYLAAFRHGDFTLETLVPAAPIVVSTGTATPPKWIANYDGEFKGTPSPSG